MSATADTMAMLIGTLANTNAVTAVINDLRNIKTALQGCACVAVGRSREVPLRVCSQRADGDHHQHYRVRRAGERVP